MDIDDQYDLSFVESTYGETIGLEMIPTRKADPDNEDPWRRRGHGPLARLYNELGREMIGIQ